MQDPDGVPRNVFPRILSIVMDDPESKEVFGVKGGNCSHPCEICWVPHDMLGNMIHADWPERTAAELVRGFMSVKCHPLCAAVVWPVQLCTSLEQPWFGWCICAAKPSANALLTPITHLLTFQASIFESVRRAPTAAAREALCRQYSTHNVLSGYFGFADQAEGYGSITHALGGESLHNDDLGVWPKLCTGISAVLKAKQGGRCKLQHAGGSCGVAY